MRGLNVRYGHAQLGASPTLKTELYRTAALQVARIACRQHGKTLSVRSGAVYLQWHQREQHIQVHLQQTCICLTMQAYALVRRSFRTRDEDAAAFMLQAESFYLNAVSARYYQLRWCPIHI